MSTPMRKQSRQMSPEFALDVFDRAPYTTMSVTDGQMPYAVPLNIARTDERTFYFHSAMEGRKLDIIRKNSNVCLTAVSRCKPLAGPKDGSFTLEYESATAFAKAEIVEDDEEKIMALRAICQRFLPQHMDAFDAAIGKSLARTAVVRLVLTEEPVGKRKRYDSNGDEMKYGRMA